MDASYPAFLIFSYKRVNMARYLLWPMGRN